MLTECRDCVGVFWPEARGGGGGGGMLLVASQSGASCGPNVTGPKHIVARHVRAGTYNTRKALIAVLVTSYSNVGRLLHRGGAAYGAGFSRGVRGVSLFIR